MFVLYKNESGCWYQFRKMIGNQATLMALAGCKDGSLHKNFLASAFSQDHLLVTRTVDSTVNVLVAEAGKYRLQRLP